MDLSRYGYGFGSAVPLDMVRELAPRVEEAGFRTLWVNQGMDGNALESLEVAAAVTTRLRLATGVIAVDRGPTGPEIVAEVKRRRLPLDRLVIGIGASAKPSPLTTVSEAISAIRQGLGVPVVVGALGPKMRELGVTKGDGLLLNWLTPEHAAAAAKDADAVDRREGSEVALYVRCSLGAASRAKMESEAARYGQNPSYAANFERLDFQPMEAAVCAETPDELRAGLAAFADALDEPVLRAIVANETVKEYVQLIDAAAS